MPAECLSAIRTEIERKIELYKGNREVSIILNAIKNNDINFLKYLYCHQPRLFEITFSDRAITIMLLLIRDQRLQWVEMLDKVNPDLKYAKDRVGFGAMHIAVVTGNLKLIKLLNKLDPQLLRSKSNVGLTPMHVAVKQGNMGVIKLLRELDNTLRMTRPEFNSISLFDEPDNEGRLTIYIATMIGRCDIIEYMHGIDNALINKINEETGTSILHIASINGQEDVVRLLIRFNKELVSKLRTDGNNAMHLAAIRGHLSIIEILYETDNSLIFQKNLKGHTPIICAELFNQHEVFNYLKARYSFWGMAEIFKGKILGW